MKTILADCSGFCGGVKKTIQTIEALLADAEGPVSCIGLPVHNSQVTGRLVDAGLRVVDTLEEVDEGILVIRAHGLPPRMIEEAKEKGLTVINSTCGFVMHAQKIAHSLCADGYSVIIAGEKDHAEVKSIVGYVDDTAHVVSSPEELESLKNVFSLNARIGILQQTTFLEKETQLIIKGILEHRYAELKVCNTVCKSIEKRMTAARDIAQHVDCMLIVGGKMSSNTKRLYETCCAVNVNSHHIETETEFQAAWFKDAGVVGVTAGASTSDWLIDNVINAVDVL